MNNYNVNLWAGRFVVVETDSDVFVGTLEILNDSQVRILTGMRGRPPIVDIIDIDTIANANLSDLVEA